MNPKKDPLHSLEQLPPDVADRLKKLLRVRTYVAGESIFLQDADPRAVYLVASGRVKVMRVTKEGYESILCVRGPGDYFCPVPLLDKGTHLGTAVAINDVTVFECEQEEFCRICHVSPELTGVVQKDCLSEVRHLLNRFEAFAFRSVRERLALALIEERNRQVNDPPQNEIRLKQQELASLIGASRESVSRILNQLERENIVTLKRGRVILHNLEKIRKLAGDS